MLNKFSWVFLETIFTTFFQFMSVIILARMLQPRDYGLLGMMIIFIALGNMIVDSGMGSAIVKKYEVCQDDYSTLFIYNFIVSCIIYIIIFSFAIPIATFYNTPELAILIRVLSLVIIISAFGVVQNAILNRLQKFKLLAIVSLVSNLFSLSLAIILAWLGYGVWALIYQQLSLILIRVVMLFFMARFVPTLSFSVASVKYQFGFGINILTANILQTIFANISSSIVPKIASVIQNGYYVQANKLQNVPVAILTMITDKAMFPILARHSDVTLLKESARTIIRYTALVAFPFIFFCSALSKQIVLVLLGSNWLEAAVYLEILFFAGLGICVQYYGKNLFKAIGDTRKILYLELIKTTIGLVILLISFNFGLLFLMYGIVMASVISALVTMMYLDKYLNYSILQHLSDLKLAFLLSFVSYVIIKILNVYVLSDSLWGLVCFVLGCIIYLLLGLVFKSHEIMEIFTLVKNCILYHIQRSAIK